MGQDWPVIDLGEPATVAEVLARQPLVRARFAARPDLATVPFLASRSVEVEQVLSALDRTAHQMLFLVRHHGQLTRSAATAEAPDLDPMLLDRAARDLVVTGLGVVNGRWLVLHPGVATLVPTPQPLFSEGSSYLTSADLDRACHLLGLPKGTRKGERVEAMLAVLSDAGALDDALSAVSDAARRVYSLVLQRTADLSPGRDDRPGVQHTYEFLPPELRMSAARSGLSRGGSVLPIDELCDRLLLGSDWGRHDVWVWAESVVALAGSMFACWDPPPVPDLVSLDTGSINRVAAVLHALDEVVRAAAASSPVGNRTGGRRPPVKYWRSVAKAAGLDAELVAMAGAAAIELGLLVPELGPRKGRGRAMTQDCAWHPEPDRVAEFGRSTPAERWALAVRAWMSPEVLPDPSGERDRRLLVELLRSLPEGLGVPTSSLGAWAAAAHGGLVGAVVDDVMADAVRLGLVSEGSAVGLSAAGRALLDRPSRLGELLDTGSCTVTVQADHTLIAPTDLSADVVVGLRRIADVESEGAVTVWRLSARKLTVAAACADGFDPLSFLELASEHELPSGVARFVADAASTASPVALRAIGCVLTGDPVAVAEAARHRAAKLELLAPGVAVSPLAEGKVGEILQSKGVLLGSGVALGSGSPVPARVPPPTWEVPHRAPADPWPDGVAAGAGAFDLGDLARRAVEGRR